MPFFGEGRIFQYILMHVSSLPSRRLEGWYGCAIRLEHLSQQVLHYFVLRVTAMTTSCAGGSDLCWLFVQSMRTS